MSKIGYMRISTEMQVHDLQEQALKKVGCDEIFQDTITGKTTTRSGLDACLAKLGRGDTLVVWKLDRLGRRVVLLKTMIEALNKRGVAVFSVTENIDTSTATGNLFIGMLAVFAEFERDLIGERTKAGIAAKRVDGRAWGRRPAVEYDEVEVVGLLGQMPPAWVAQKTGLSLSTVRRVARRAA